jgi:hypothetical protein
MNLALGCAPIKFPSRFILISEKSIDSIHHKGQRCEFTGFRESPMWSMFLVT